MNSQIPAKQQPKFSVAITTDKYRRLIQNTLGDANRAKRFTAAITSAVAVNPELQECETSSIVAGALLGESLNLSPSPQLGQYFLIPFEQKLKGPDGKVMWVRDEEGNILKDKNGKFIAVTKNKAQFCLGYKGYVQLALRSGSYLDMDVMEIKSGEYLGRDRETGKPRFQFIEDDTEREALPTVGYMAYFEYLNGFRKVIYWSKEKVMIHADRHSKAYSMKSHRKILDGEIDAGEMWRYSSDWYKDFDGMAKKTVLKQLISKWGIMSTDLQRAITADNSFVALDDKGEIFTDEEEEPADIPDLETPIESKPADGAETIDFSAIDA